jgi:hypothetical protein
MISSQFGQPIFLKSAADCTIEQSRHARKFFAFWAGIIASAMALLHQRCLVYEL